MVASVQFQGVRQHPKTGVILLIIRQKTVWQTSVAAIFVVGLLLDVRF